jgi:hypothetical protein
MPVMTESTIWRFEARRCGAAALALPLTVAAALIALAAALAGNGTAVGTGMVRLTSTVFPVACGIAAATAVGRERLLELQLTVATPYPTTFSRRLAVIAAVVLIGAAALVGALQAAGLWQHPARGPLALLVPIGPALFLVGLAAWAAAALRSTAAASTVVIGGWLFQVFLWDAFVAVWQLNRGLLIAAGVLLTYRALRRLRDPERLLTGSQR